MGSLIQRKKKIMIQQGLNPNIFTHAGEMEGYYLRDSGLITATTEAWTVSDFIKVRPNKTYTFEPNSTAGGSARHGYFDEDKHFMSAINSGPQTFTTPQNAYYMRFSYRTTSYNIELKLST